MAIVYVGKRLPNGQTQVQVRGIGKVAFLPHPRTGHPQTLSTFEWADVGANSYLLALAILYHAFPKHRSIARQWASWFLEDVVQYFPLQGWQLSRCAVFEWIFDQRIDLVGYQPLVFQSDN